MNGIKKALPTIIESSRLMLITMTGDFLKHCLEGEREKAESILGYRTHDEWWNERDLMRLRYEQIQKSPSLASWQLRAMILKSNGEMIGHFNGHTAPGANYLKEFSTKKAIELGFTVYTDFRRKGYSSEAVRKFSDLMKDLGLAETIVISLTPNDQAMLNFVSKLGFVEAGLAKDTDGEEIVFTLDL